MFGSAFIGDVQQAAFGIPKVVVERVVHHHADERANDQGRINFDKGTVLLSLANVVTEELIELEDNLVEKHLCQFVFLQG